MERSTRVERSHELGCGRRRIGADGPSATKRFELAGAEPSYLPDRPFVVEHTSLDLALDFDRHRLEGTAVLTVVARRRADRLRLDAVNLEVRSVTRADAARGAVASSAALAFDVSPGSLTVQVGRREPGERFQVAIAYATRPQRGLYFVGPDSQHPKKPRQAWTQGQDEDARAWFPCLDRPRDRTKLDIRATVPAPLEAFANGVLVETSEDPKARTRTFHWRLEQEIPPYLATLVAGEFARLEDRWEDVPIRFLVPAHRLEDAKLSFAPTKAMLSFFSEWTGVRYPWPRYDQVCVEDFIFGGMENVSQTTLTTRTLHDRRAHEDFRSDPLVSHELAHQWFGDLVTCSDWCHGWLNEGFATYAECLWKEKSEGKDEALYYTLQVREDYLEEFDSRYSRPIVQRVYHAPIDIFDRHLYEKGGSFLHYLRFLLGEDDLRASVKHYLTEHRGRAVETVDLERAIFAATGRDLTRVFDEYVHGRGHPSVKVSFEYDEEKRTGALTLEQTQDPSAARDVFRLELDVAFARELERETHRLSCRERKQTFHFALAKKPDWVAVDPGGWALATFDVSELASGFHRAALAHEEDPITRVRAARALGKKGTPEDVAALAKAAAGDRFWGVAAEAAQALGAVRTEQARRALEDALAQNGHPKARRAVAKALGEFTRDEAAASVLANVLDGDRTWLVEAEAAKALGRTRVERAVPSLEKALASRESWNDVIRAHALEGLAATRDPRAFAAVLPWTAFGKDEGTRAAAVRAVGALGDVGGETTRKEALARLADLLRDPELRTRIAAVGALETLADARGLMLLDDAAGRDQDGRVRRLSREAAQRLREGHEGGAKLAKVRDDLDQSRDEARKLKDRLERLEAYVESRLPKDGPTTSLPGRNAPRG